MKKERLYAIVDIETTGGFAQKSNITEIAIIIHDGDSVQEKYQTLINPEQNIPYHIQQLTGITNEMVENAPLFSQVADEIFELLNNKIFVAHNVNFDYSFLVSSFKNIGIQFKAPKLCTVRLSRKFFPNQYSYSLGNLCQSLDIPLHNRHRAMGDAEATAILFHQILNLDSDNLISDLVKVKSKTQRLPANVTLSDFEKLPESAGIYQFKDQKGKLIYVGKAINIKKRVASHFSGNNDGARRQGFLNEIYSIDFEETGTELMALLIECDYIQNYWPKYNRALKRFEPKFQVVSYYDQIGYKRLAIVKSKKGVIGIKSYDRVYDATKDVLELMENFNLNPLFITFYNEEIELKTEKLLRLKTETLPSITDYNDCVEKAIEDFTAESTTFYIIDKGRNDTEKSCVLVKNNQLYSKGFIPTDAQINTEEDFDLFLERSESNFYKMQLISSFVQANSRKVSFIRSEDTE